MDWFLYNRELSHDRVKVNRFKSLIIFAKSSFVVVWQGSEYASEFVNLQHKKRVALTRTPHTN